MPGTQTKHGFFTNPADFAERGSGAVVEDLTLGLHKGKNEAALAPGFTPDSRNFEKDQGGIRPRSGVSSFTTFSMGEPALGAIKVSDFEGDQFAFAFGQTQVSMLDPNIASLWTSLSYVSAAGFDDAPSGTSFDYWQSTSIFDISNSSSLVLFANGVNFPKFTIAGSGTTTYSDYTWLNDSFDTLDTVKVLATVNDRLIAANVISSGDTSYPNRVLYSQRGNPKIFSPGVTAGFFDIAAMKGEILAIAELEDRAYVFSEEEIWQLDATFDWEAFRADKLIAKIGTIFPNSIQETPQGIMFLGTDLDIYLLTTGGNIRNISRLPNDTESRTRAYMRQILTDETRVWGQYDVTAHAYKLFFSTLGSTVGYPNRAWYVSLDNLSIFEMRFGAQNFSFGLMLNDPDTITTYDDLVGITYEDINATYADLTDEGEGRLFTVWDSGGSMYRFLPNFSTDNGSEIDCRWRSGGLATVDAEQVEMIRGAWVEYAAPSNSSLTVRLLSGRDEAKESEHPVVETSHEILYVPTRLYAPTPGVEFRAPGEVKLNVEKVTLKSRAAGTLRNRNA